MNVEHGGGWAEHLSVGGMAEASEIAGDAFHRGAVTITVSEGRGAEIRMTIVWNPPYQRQHLHIAPDPPSVPAA